MVTPSFLHQMGVASIIAGVTLIVLSHIFREAL